MENKNELVVKENSIIKAENKEILNAIANQLLKLQKEDIRTKSQYN